MGISISSIQMLTPAADQRGAAQGKVTQLNLSRLRHYEFGPVALKKHLSSQKKFDRLSSIHIISK